MATVNLKEIIFRNVKLIIRKKRKASASPAARPLRPIRRNCWLTKRRIKQCAGLLLLAGVIALFFIPSPPKTSEKVPLESLDGWIEGTLIPSLTSRPDEFHKYWYNDWDKKGSDVWAVGGVTFTTEGYGTINFVYHSKDNGKTWQVAWRTDSQTDTRFFGARKVDVKSGGRATVSLVGQFNHVLIIQTADGGKTWTVK